MGITFLTPWAGLIGLAALLPMAAYALGQRRVARVRAVLGLLPASGRRRLVAPGAAVAVVGLLALAAAQPVRSERRTASTRSDAEVFVVIDASRSMAAAAQPGAPTRFDRARLLAREVRRRLPAVRVGLASMTDRVLPHLFPSPDAADFNATLSRALAIDRPPPKGRGRGTTTSLDSLGTLGVSNFFARTSRKRIALAITDGESKPSRGEQLLDALQRANIDAVFVQVWQRGERIFTPQGVDAAYREDVTAPVALRQLGSTMHAPVYGEESAAAVADRVRGLLGSGPRVDVPSRTTVQPLAPYLALVAVLPLGLVLRRRNL